MWDLCPPTALVSPAHKALGWIKGEVLSSLCSIHIPYLSTAQQKQSRLSMSYQAPFKDVKSRFLTQKQAPLPKEEGAAVTKVGQQGLLCHLASTEWSRKVSLKDRLFLATFPQAFQRLYSQGCREQPQGIHGQNSSVWAPTKPAAAM